MDTLPPELLRAILHHIPHHTYQRLRLVSHRFNAILAPLSFPALPVFLSPSHAISVLALMAEDLLHRPGAAGSAGCGSVFGSAPRYPHVRPEFLRAVWAVVTGIVWGDGAEGGEGDKEAAVDTQGNEHAGQVPEDFERREGPTVEELRRRSGKATLTEQGLLAAQHRYALYLAYVRVNREWVQGCRNGDMRRLLEELSGPHALAAL
jgi:hypothetical protein